jgi:hypothetical protein
MDGWYVRAVAFCNVNKRGGRARTTNARKLSSPLAAAAAAAASREGRAGQGRAGAVDSSSWQAAGRMAPATNGLESFLSGGFGGICLVLVGHPWDLIKVRETWWK